MSDSAPNGPGMVMKQSESSTCVDDVDGAAPGAATTGNDDGIQLAGVIKPSMEGQDGLEEGKMVSDMDGCIRVMDDVAFAEDDVEVSEEYAALFGEEEEQDKLQELEW